MPRQLRMAALAIAVMVAFSCLSLAQYHDDDDDGGYHQGNPRQARQYGYQQGYRDGYAKGRHEGRENDPNDYQTPDWRQATRGYEQWMGPVETFQNGYRDGYGSGFQAGYQSLNRGWGNGDGDGDGDRDRGGYDRGGDIYDQSGYGYGGNIGYRAGYQDGISQAREDTYKNKRFNSNPRGKYDDRDHGYRREYGDKNSYKAQYSDGYRAGYEASFRR
jgi:hypothetical protein